MNYKRVRIDDEGDPSVGIFPSFWTIEGDICFDDDMQMEEFRNKLQAAFECITDSVTITFSNDLLNSIELNRAQSNIKAVEEEFEKQESIRLEALRKDLEQLFKNNDKLIIKEFHFSKEFGTNIIIPDKPYLDEEYSGELDDEIEALAKKHCVIIKIASWCYGK